MRLQFPLKIEFEITSRCNLKCNHCMIEINKKKNELNALEIKKLIDDWHKCGLMELQFTGGEPTIRSDLIEIIEYSRQKGLKVLLSTNGTLIFSLSVMIAEENFIVITASLCVFPSGKNDFTRLLLFVVLHENTIKKNANNMLIIKNLFLSIFIP